MVKLIDFVNVLSEELKLQGRISTRKKYLSTYRSVLTYSKECQITLGEVFCKEFLLGYQEFLLNKGCCFNTVSSYMRVLRAIRNKAEKRKIITTDIDLFDHVYTGSETTVKRAVSLKTILALNNVDLSHNSSLAFSRDLFMLSFYLQGMSFVDLAHLRKTNVKGDLIIYHRRKTGSMIAVPILPPARTLLERYMNNNTSPYLLPIISIGGDATKQYDNAIRKYNRHLKKLAELIGVSDNLTSYVSRHSWATTAYHIGVSTSVIGEAMGHRSEEMTRVYLASFTTDMLASANRKVLESLFGAELEGDKNVQVLLGDGHKYGANIEKAF